MVPDLGRTQETLLADARPGQVPPRPVAAPAAAQVHHRGPAVLDVDDCNIVVYELFGDRV